MLTDKDVALLRQELQTAKNPLFIHDDDADGLASFLLLYRIHREGRGISPKTGKLDKNFIHKVEEINPDKIFVLDIPVMDQEFVDGVKRPIFWIDHHQPLERQKVHYFNPRLKDPDAYIPTTRMAWQVSENPDDLWIATLGCLADWHLPDFISEFIQKHPHLLPKKKDLTDAVYKQPVGKLVKMFFFLLKGPTSEVRKSIKILTRIKTPEEIINQETAAGKFLWRRFVSINQRYEKLLLDAKKYVTNDKIFLYFYGENEWSFTANLANELTQLYPEKVIIICRRKDGEMKCSFRAHFPIVELLQKALQGVKGFGGGHPVACGAV
ncbi:MAG: DHH family phosphoesterase, partial [Nanoarchaeota archaeon]|nr:DHH family phosphoesterase [Nanoarchaeota archaeon]